MRFFFHTSKLFFTGSINSFTPTPSYGGNIYHCNFYTCGQNPMMLPCKWNPLGKTCVWCYLILSILQFSNVVNFFLWFATIRSESVPLWNDAKHVQQSWATTLFYITFAAVLTFNNQMKLSKAVTIFTIPKNIGEYNILMT